MRPDAYYLPPVAALPIRAQREAVCEVIPPDRP